MQKIDLTKNGGLPLTQNLLNFLQDGFREPLIAIASLLGNKVIVMGMDEGSSSVADGWFVYNNELIKFNTCAIGTKVKITETLLSVEFEDGLTKAVYKIKTAVCDATGDFDYADFVRLDTLKEQKATIGTLGSTLSTVSSALTALSSAYASHSHSWASITGKPAGFITCVGVVDLGDIGTTGGGSDTIVTVTIPVAQADNNYIIAGSMVGFNTDLNYDNDVSWVVGSKTSSSFQLAVREYSNVAQSLKFEYAIIKTS
ncbi:MAG: hypothetical protein NTZ59_15485 [Bacteroidetes bacterium]|jgi:hypothetical protein|nr:hypothetical protein [Bacteroidota bacterium]